MDSKVLNFLRWSGAILHYNGWIILCWRILQRSLLPIGRLELVTFWEKDLTQPLNDVSAEGNVTITLATLPDIPTLVRLMNERQKKRLDTKQIEFEKLVLSRFWSGNHCYLGKIGAEIVHYNWTSFNWEETLGGRIARLEPDEAFCLDAFTSKEWRGKKIYPAAHHHMLQVLQDKGIRKAYTLIDADNTPSKKIHVRQGWQPFATVVSFTPRGTSLSRIWKIKGNPGRFLEKKSQAEVNA